MTLRSSFDIALAALFVHDLRRSRWQLTSSSSSSPSLLAVALPLNLTQPKSQSQRLRLRADCVRPMLAFLQIVVIYRPISKVNLDVALSTSSSYNTEDYEGINSRKVNVEEKVFVYLHGYFP
jgi:hypothetical protein